MQSESSPSGSADWSVDGRDGAFVLTLPAAGKALAVAGDGTLVLADAGTPFNFEPAEGCAAYPEADTKVSGEPSRGATSYGEVSGLLDAHMHMMAFEFLGGRVHCGRPWHPFGVASALVDCPDHEPAGAGAIGENLQMWERAVGVPPARCHPKRARATRRGIGRVRLRARANALLRRAGQPARRARTWTWCVRRGGTVRARLTRAGRVVTVKSTAPRHRALGARPGRRLKAATRRRTRRVAPGLRARRVRGRHVLIRVRKGRVRWVGTTTNLKGQTL